MFKLDQIRQFDYNVFLRRLGQESIVVILGFFLVTVVYLNMIQKNKHAAKMMRIEKDFQRYQEAANLKKLQKGLPDFKELTFDAGDANFFISLLDNLLRKNEVLDVAIVPGEVRKTNGAKLLSFSVQFVGHLPAIMTILKELETNKKLVYVSFFKMNHAEVAIDRLDKVEDPFLAVSMNVNFFAKD